MGLELPPNPDSTPVDEGEREALLVPTITTVAELDEFEQLNVEDAVQWSLRSRFPAEVVLTESFLKHLHARMFGQTWSWAGQFRTTNKNLGVDKFEIPVHLRALIDDTRFWIRASTYEPDEICIRLKHRLVSIHCFPNGNGRHARLAADILVEGEFGLPVFTWGGAILGQAGAARWAYIAALKEADAGNIAPLLAFARSG